MKRRRFFELLGAVPLAATAASAGATFDGGVHRPGRPDWAAVRDLFPLDSSRAYLNTGGLGPAAAPVLEGIHRQHQLSAVEGEHHHDLLNDVRATAAEFFGADPEEICFTRNASESNSIICAGLDLKPGDEVIFESHAHPGGSFAWLNRQKVDGIRVRIFDPDPSSPEGNLERIADLINPRTRVIQVSHVTAPTGLRFDVDAISRMARERGIWFHIDGAQSAGMFEIDLHQLQCDSYGTSGHKWLNGPIETGLLYIAKARMDEVQASHLGAYSSDSYHLPDQFEVVPRASRHEYGTRNAGQVVGLGLALELQDRIGRPTIARHGRDLADLARAQLSSLKAIEILTPSRPEMCESILTFSIPGQACGDINQYLSLEHNLRCRVVNERNLNAVRTSWHVYNNEREVDRLVAGVRGYLKTI